MNEAKLFADLPRGRIPEILKDRIIDAIVCGDLKPGEKIPTETQFSEKLGIARGPVREAVKVLVAFGVLEIRHAEGTFVVQEYNSKLLNPLFYDMIISRGSMYELLELKIVLYQSLLFLAMRKATDEQIQHLQNLCQKYRNAMLEPTPDVMKIYETNECMKRYLTEIAGNDPVSRVNELTLKIASYSCVKAIEVSIQRGRTHAMPDSYAADFEMLAQRDKAALAGRMDEKLALWQDLLCD
ncbi:MAG: regulatory protein GntR [Firmicutes bacterium]|nr:regulatory protein GntR [Bacillota bacterium]